METISAAMKTAFAAVQTDVTSMISTSARYHRNSSCCYHRYQGFQEAYSSGLVFCKSNSYHTKKGKGLDALALFCISFSKPAIPDPDAAA